MDLTREEYVALRANNSSRRDNMNKMNTSLVTFVTAVLTISVSLFLVVDRLCNLCLSYTEKIAENVHPSVVELCKKELVSAQVSTVAIQLFQGLLLLMPVINHVH